MSEWTGTRTLGHSLTYLVPVQVNKFKYLFEKSLKKTTLKMEDNAFTTQELIRILNIRCTERLALIRAGKHNEAHVMSREIGELKKKIADLINQRNRWKRDAGRHKPYF